MYSGFEAAFLAAAIHGQWDAPPMWLLYLVTAMIIVPLNWFGISQMHWLQKWSIPIFAVGLVWVVIEAAQRPSITAAGAQVGWDTVLPALAAILANVGIWILLIGDYARFVRSEDRGKAIAMAGTAGRGFQFIMLPALGGWLALRAGSANPGTYAVGMAGVAGLIWVVITQLRVQEGNYYLSSLSLSTFVSRTFRVRLPRPVFLIVTGLIAFVLAQLGITDHLTEVLTFMGVFLLAWVGTVVGSLLVQRKEIASGDAWVEHRRPYLRPWGFPALTGLVVASAAGGTLALTNWPEPYGGFLGIAVAAVLAPAITIALHRRPVTDILAPGNKPDPDWRDAGPLTDRDLARPAAQVTCEATGGKVMKADACHWPVGSDRVVSARTAETE